MLEQAFRVALRLTLLWGIAASAAHAEAAAAEGTASLAALKEALSLFQSLGITSAMVIVGDDEESEVPFGLLGDTGSLSVVAAKRRGMQGVRFFPQGIVVFLQEYDSLGWLRHLPVLSKVVFISSHNPGATSESQLWEFPYSLLFTIGKTSDNFTGGGNDRFDTFQMSKLGSSSHIATFRGNKFKFLKGNKSVLKEAFKVCTDFGDKTFPAVAFKFPPYSMPNFGDKSVGHGGHEYILAKTITDGLQLKMDLQPPSVGKMWGYQVPPGSGNYTGLKIRIFPLLQLWESNNNM